MYIFFFLLFNIMKIKIKTVSWMFKNIIGDKNYLFFDDKDYKLYKKVNNNYELLPRQNIYKKN